MRGSEHPRCGRCFVGRGVPTPDESQDGGQRRVTWLRCSLALVPALGLLSGIVISQEVKEVEIGHTSMVRLDGLHHEWQD
jgi:hypothetical protein